MELDEVTESLNGFQVSVTSLHPQLSQILVRQHTLGELGEEALFGISFTVYAHVVSTKNSHGTKTLCF